jgi:hypothetical protein
MTAFNTWKTRFDETATLLPSLNRLPIKDRMVKEATTIRCMMESGSMDEQGGTCEMLRLGEEYLWLVAGKPYYNVHPRLVGQLCNCRLDKLPASYLEVPGGFDTVLIRFADSSPELQVEENEYVRSILMARSVVSLPAESFVDLFDHGKAPMGFDSIADKLTLRIDLGDRGECDRLSYIREWVIGVRLLPDRTLDQEFATFEDAAPELIAPGTRRREVLVNCLRLIATVGLIANSPEENLLQYDVLSKDRAAFAAADAERRQQLIDKARRRGKHGWNVGTNELFIGDVPRWSASATGGSGREHSHAHIRSGHLHAVRCGTGRRDVKIKWFRPTVVRPDLPFASV